MPDIVIPYNWQPREYQREFFKKFEQQLYGPSDCKRAVLCWHRRSGKDDVALQFMALSMALRPGNYWYMLPKANQARKAIWDAINPHTGIRRIDQAFPRSWRSAWRDTDMWIQSITGSTFQVVGSDNFENLLGSPPIGIVFSEYAMANPRAWGLLRPILAENGGWAIFDSTPRGKNHFWRMLKMAQQDPHHWFSQVLTVRESSIFRDEQLEVELKEMTTEYGREEGEALFEQEYLCNFDAPILGSYYGQQMRTMEAEGRICRIGVERGARVFTSWDIGMDDYTAIVLWQCVARERRIVHYYENSGVGFDHYVAYLQEWRAKHKITWGEHYLPHDIKVRELGTGQGRLQTLSDLGLIDLVVVPNHVREDGINASRRMLDRVWIDNREETGGERIIECLRNYAREYDEERHTWKDGPRRDEFTHGADAVRYFAVGFDDPKAVKPIHRAISKEGSGAPSFWSA